MTRSRNTFVHLITRFFNVTAIATLAIVLFANQAESATSLYWLSTSGTSSWFTVSNWNSSYTGSGSNYLPTADNTVILDSGVCSLDSGSNAVVDHVNNYPAWAGGTSYTLNIETGATLTVSNYCRIGNERVDGTINVRGTLDVINAKNSGFVLGSYTVRTATNNTGTLNIDGGLVTFGKGVVEQAMLIGGTSTGLVEITNGGCFNSRASVKLGSAGSDQSDGTVIIQDGVWTNKGTIVLGMTQTDNGNTYRGTGKIIINGGALYSTKFGDSFMDIGHSSTGRVVINSGEIIGQSAFNNTNANANRSMITVGSKVGGLRT